jgi:thiol-disulfide isomerase/thioredoxin
MKLRTLALIAAALAACCAFAAGDPDEALAAINKYRTDTIAKAREAGTQLNAVELSNKIKEMALEAIKDVQPMKVEPAKAYSWAQLFNMAGKYEDIHMLCDMYQTTKPTEQLSFSAHYLCLQSFAQLRKYDMATETLKEMPLPSVVNAYSAAMIAANSFAPGLAREKKFDQAYEMLGEIESRLPSSDENAQNQTYLDNARASLAAANANVLKEEKGIDVAVKYIDNKIKNAPTETLKAAYTRSASGMKADVTRARLIGAAAPMFPVERTIGEFKDFASLKGKVVIIDFFAHWCGPCIASFPDMRKMYDDLKGQGLEIISATTYYGYYKSENTAKRDMDKDTEFARMSDFMKDNKMNWPVVYSDRSLFEIYGVTGIPTTFLIDREGNVHSFHVGYSADSFKTFRAEVEAMLKAKN